VTYRDLHAIDPAMDASSKPALLIRQGVVLVNMPPLHAAVTRAGVFLFPEPGADSDLEPILAHLRRYATAASTSSSSGGGVGATAVAAAGAAGPGACGGGDGDGGSGDGVALSGSASGASLAAAVADSAMMGDVAGGLRGGVTPTAAVGAADAAAGGGGGGGARHLVATASASASDQLTPQLTPAAGSASGGSASHGTWEYEVLTTILLTANDIHEKELARCVRVRVRARMPACGQLTVCATRTPQRQRLWPRWAAAAWGLLGSRMPPGTVRRAHVLPSPPHATYPPAVHPRARPSLCRLKFVADAVTRKRRRGEALAERLQ
jgi:hypothetical protein